MTEENRLKIIKELNILKEKRRKYLELKKEYNNLTKTEEVKRFLELSSRLEKTKSDNESNDILVARARNSVIKENCCNHDIWVYIGSYYEVDNYERSYSIMLPNERDKKFEYNVYACLECNSRIRVTDYKEFEKTHFVLKRKKCVNIYELRKLYFKYLVSMKTENANKKLIKQFEGDKQ